MTAKTATTPLLCWVVLTASAATSCAQASERVSSCGEDRFAFQPTITAGPARVVYNGPIGRVVDWEVQRYLGSIGFTNRRRPQPGSGIDSMGRRWWRDSIGYPYYVACLAGCLQRVYYHPRERAIAGQVNDILARVDFRRAVRGAARDIAIRGLNSASSTGDQIRKSVRDAVVRKLNQTRPGGDEWSEFQQLVQAGIEDAMVEAFNLIDNLPDDPRHRDDAEPVQDVRGAQTERPRHATETQDKAAKSALSGPTQAYHGSTVVFAGWVVTDGNILPLMGGSAYEIMVRRDSLELVDVWQNGRRIAADCRFVRYFEDAKTMLKQDIVRLPETEQR